MLSMVFCGDIHVLWFSVPFYIRGLNAVPVPLIFEALPVAVLRKEAALLLLTQRLALVACEAFPIVPAVIEGHQSAQNPGFSGANHLSTTDYDS